MSAIALTLNLLLGLLLVAALFLGWRLEQRLKALRSSHQSFIKAVEDLDRAAARAEQGLADLRAATDEASEALAGRIEKARTLAAKLDASADRIAGAQPAARPSSPRETPPRDMGRALRDDLILEETARPRPTAEVKPIRPSGPPPAPRPRARADDDLFSAPTRAAGGRP